VIGWLAKIALVFAVAGFVLFDAISVGSTMATVSDQGASAAREASAVWDGTKMCRPPTTPRCRRRSSRTPRNVVTPKGFSIDADGTVHLRISREARTLILFRWERTRKWAEVSKEARGRSLGD
jgi:hypothetical protein